MKPFLVFLWLLGGAAWGGAQSPVAQAFQTLRTNMVGRERLEAFRILNDQQELPAWAAADFGRIVAGGGPEAATAAGLLPRLGHAALPIIVKLLESPASHDTVMVLTYSAAGWSPTNEMAYVVALRPLFRRRPGEAWFQAAMAMSALRLSVTNAAALTREMLEVKSYYLHYMAAALVAKQACGWPLNPGDETLFREMQGSESAVVQYAGLLYEETVKGLRWIGGKRAPPPLTPAEQERRERSAARLRELGARALQECLGHIKTAHGADEPLSLLYAAQLIHAQVPPTERAGLARALRGMRVTRGSMLDQAIDTWCINFLERE